MSRSRAPSRNCLLARRLAERGVRFIQLYPSRLGSAHEPARSRFAASACDTDQPSAALIQDLKQRGLLDDTLVIWGGEFGRTVYCQGNSRPRTVTAATIIRDASRSGWRAAASSRASATARRTTIATTLREDPVHVHDLNATVLHCLGIDHTKLTYRFQGRDFRLTDVHGEVVRGILA